MGCMPVCREWGHQYNGGCIFGTNGKPYSVDAPVTNGTYRVVASIPFEYPGELYSETFIMEGKSERDVRARVNALLADTRYIVAIRKV